MTIRLCFDARVIRSWDSGVGRMAAALLRHAPAVAPDLEVHLLLHDAADRVPAGLPSAMPIARTGWSSPSIRQHLELPRFLEEQGFDAVFHLHPYSVPFWPRLPTVVAVLDVYQLNDPSSFPRGTATYFRWVVAPATARANRVLTISESSKAEIVQLLGVSPGRIGVVPLAAEPVFGPVSDPERHRVLASLGVQGPYLLYHGNQRPHKNITRLVEAFAVLRRGRGCPHRLVVTGEERPGSRDRDFTELRAAIARAQLEDSLILPGRVSDQQLAALYSGAGAVFLPSLMEGFGLPVVEAFACGTPVVCSNRGALPEVAGNAAALVDPMNVDEMAEVLAAVLSDPIRWEQMSCAGLRRAREFSWPRAAALFADQIRHVVHG